MSEQPLNLGERLRALYEQNQQLIDQNLQMQGQNQHIIFLLENLYEQVELLAVNKISTQQAIQLTLEIAQLRAENKELKEKYESKP